MYPELMVTPMRQQLLDVGFEQLMTAEAVEEKIVGYEGTTLVVVNSVCGCAAANARPGVIAALSTAENKPDQCTTVFAGMEKEATDKARELMLPYPPSSPSIALFKNGTLVHMLERHHIEGRPAEMIAENLVDAMNTHC